MRSVSFLVFVCVVCFPGSVSGDGLPGPSPELLASLQSLRENSDYTLLPHSLHQVCVCVCVCVCVLFSSLKSRENMCLYLVRQKGFVCGCVCVYVCL